MSKDSNSRADNAREGAPGSEANRRDQVGGSGVYPASAGNAPDDAEVRTPGEWGAGAGGEEGGRSELRLSEEEIRAGKNREQGGAGKAE